MTHRRVLFLAVLLASLLALKFWVSDGGDEPGYATTMPTSKPAPTRWQIRVKIPSTQPMQPGASEAAEPAVRFDALELDVPGEILAQIEKAVGKNPFADVRMQLQDLHGRPKLRAVGTMQFKGTPQPRPLQAPPPEPATAPTDTPGPVEYTFVLKEMMQERRKGQRGFAGWINLRPDGDAANDVQTFFHARWSDAAAATTPTAMSAAGTERVPVDIVWVYAHAAKRTSWRSPALAQPSTSEREPLTSPD